MRRKYQQYFKNKNTVLYLLFLFLLLGVIEFLGSCKKYIAIDSPKDKPTSEDVYKDDATANAAILGIYRSFRGIFNNNNDPTILTGLAGDELTSFSTTDIVRIEFANDNIQTNNTYNQAFWAALYNIIYQSNAAIDGLEHVASIPDASKKQYIGEAKFLRALAYFYLTNLWGDVPLITTTDLNANQNASRTSTSEINAQIIADLQDAESRLSDNYSFSGGDRSRANKWAATSLLARIYLYKNDWLNAEAHASAVINSNNFTLVNNLDSVFLKNNKEAIFQWAQNNSDPNYEPGLFIFTTTSPNLVASRFLVNSFDSTDQRKLKWLKSNTYLGNVYYYPYKYKVLGLSVNEWFTVLRFAELILIRAEARAMQNNLTGSQTDLNTIRKRAGLPNDTATTKANLLTAIEMERRLELFAEGGHRWFDLKRTNRIDSVLSAEKPGIWKPKHSLFPIPLGDIQKDPNLTQNDGY